MYVLDANVFIKADKFEYGPEFCPAFWNWLSIQFSGGTVASVDAVLLELLRKNDKLASWAMARRKFFLDTANGITLQKEELKAWVEEQDYISKARTEFYISADFSICAYALAHNHIIVTHEQSNHPSKKKVKIPDVCKHFDIPYMNPYEMLRKERPQFILEGSVGRSLRSNFIDKVLEYPEAA